MLSSLITVSITFGIALSAFSGTTNWGRLEVTWGIPLLNGGTAYNAMPLTESDAVKKGYKQMFSCGQSLSSGNTAPGNVYAQKDGDISSMPIYNADGKLSGLIIGVEEPGNIIESNPSQFTFTKYTRSTNFNGQPALWTFYGVEALFRDPDTICNAGATDSKSNKIGDRLYFKEGSDYLKIPLTEDEKSDISSLNGNGFARGGCFTTMGFHWWRDMSVNMDCDDSHPIFLLYEDDKLVGWGIAMAHSDTDKITSSMWEHPPSASLGYFFEDGDMPTCLPQVGDRLSTIHVFHTSYALNICPLF